MTTMIILIIKTSDHLERRVTSSRVEDIPVRSFPLLQLVNLKPGFKMILLLLSLLSQDDNVIIIIVKVVIIIILFPLFQLVNLKPGFKIIERRLKGQHEKRTAFTCHYLGKNRGFKIILGQLPPNV